MKNKGYTLLELLGVIVILSVLVTLVFPSIINFIKKGNDKIDNITNELIISAAEDYINDNSSELYLTSGEEYCVSVDTLINQNYLNESLIDSSYNSKNVNVTYKDKINYKVVDNCSVCKLISGDYNEIGSKYQCKVKDNMEPGFEDGYYFYVLGTNDDGTTNLIMERNICEDGTVATAENLCYVAWDFSLRNSNGPITAMDHIYKATKDWSNIPNIIIDYTDEGNTGSYGYGGIKTTNELTQIIKKDGSIVTVLNNQTGYSNLKARMPYKREVSDYDGTNVYLYDNLHVFAICYDDTINFNEVSCEEAGYIEGIYVEGINWIQGIYGYWTSSSNIDSDACYVSSLGTISSNLNDIDFHYGVRPVITVKNVIELN